MSNFFLNDGGQAAYHTVSQLDRAREDEAAKYDHWQILPGCERKPCGKVAEFVKVTDSRAYAREHLCYEHGKDEPDTIRCLCKPQDAREYI